MERRDFLKLCALAGLGIAAPIGLTRNAYGEGGITEGPYYLVFNADGGWDTSSLMDPKGVNDINRLYREGDIRTEGPHRFAPTAGRFERGMSNEAFFAKYGRDLLTLNGLDYSTNNHDPGKRYMATGKLDSLVYPTFAALVAASKGSDVPLAFVSFGNYSATGNLLPLSRISNIGQLSLLGLPDHHRGNVSNPYHEEDFVQRRIQQALKEEHEAQGARAQLPRVERSQSMLYAAQLNATTLSRLLPYIGDEQPEEALSRQANIALAGFKAGVCVSANLNISRFDSHDDNDSIQMQVIPELLAGIDYAVERAEALGIRDKVVIVIQSEMGRTPWYNENGGKDHWSIGSVMFMGPGIRGNRVLGATDDGQKLLKVNPDTLALDAGAGGIHIRPEHLHQALRTYAGIEDHALAARFPLNLAAAERLNTLW
ncbi:MAG: DUF1501 domain-containing protein [Bradymonadaceae bacterium]|nr:DUF1501 domain-containing protein [Lujinxingiaceae bacterium]